MSLPASAPNAGSKAAGNTHGLIHAAASPLVETRRTAARIAASDATVLLTGETGTGKEVFARMIHAGSPRAGRPFVPVNCGAIPETLLESELFGYVKGAFTGAVAARRGRVAMAEGGTLFLDEVGELPLPLQVKLLRLLQERTYEPIGSSESVPASFRLIAATNRDLGEEVRVGRFRSDLYYRLHVCPIPLPALRERRCDIVPLFQHFWARRGESRAVEARVMHCLESYAWPGNVRELENLVERVSVCAEGEVIHLHDLPMAVRAPYLGAVDTTPAGRAAALEIPGAAPATEPALSQTESFPLPLPPALPSPSPSSSPSSSSSPIFFPSSPPSDAAELDTLPPPPDPPPPLEAISLPTLAAMAADARAAGILRGSAFPSTGETPTPVLQLPIDLPTMLRELENAYINLALTQTRSNKKEAAKLLGMGRTTLVEKLRRRASDRRTSGADEE